MAGASRTERPVAAWEFITALQDAGVICGPASRVVIDAKIGELVIVRVERPASERHLDAVLSADGMRAVPVEA